MHYRSLILLTTILIFASCSKTSDEEYYNLASKEYKKGNKDEAYKNLEYLVEDYPESSLAADAYFLMADILQNKTTDSTANFENYKKAVGIYAKVQYDYPNSEKAPQALFMAGFISSEFLKDYQLAAQHYKRFMKIYPDNELSYSVKEELNNLGKTPEEILASKGIETKPEVTAK